VAITGSAGLGLSKDAGIEFVQEVFATRIAVESFLRKIDVVVELGGEDAKILFLTGGNEERMNGSCAGGTGAFIDQMASLA
jgi:activator of 2-hydroxyglutaryl-CoA dehydratase